MKIPNLTDITQKLSPIINFFKQYGLFIAPVILFIAFMALLIFSFTHSSSQKANTAGRALQGQQNNSSGGTSNGTSPTETNNQPSSTQVGGEGLQESERDMPMWNAEQVPDSEFDGLNATKTILPDGSTQYSYYSDNPNRPNIIIVKGGIDVFQRTPVQADMDTTQIFPDYIAHGSKFWGANVITYIFLSKGFAYVGDPQTNKVVEQMIFQPSTIEQFMKYDTDMSENPQKPHP